MSQTTPWFKNSVSHVQYLAVTSPYGIITTSDDPFLERYYGYYWSAFSLIFTMMPRVHLWTMPSWWWCKHSICGRELSLRSLWWDFWVRVRVRDRGEGGRESQWIPLPLRNERILNWLHIHFILFAAAASRYESASFIYAQQDSACINRMTIKRDRKLDQELLMMMMAMWLRMRMLISANGPLP